MDQKFDELKAEYSRFGTTEEHKEQLIEQMQENLKERYGQDSGTITGLDGVEHSLDSKNEEDLSAIDGFLKSQITKNKLSAIGDIARQQTQNRNNYGENNPYPNN